MNDRLFLLSNTAYHKANQSLLRHVNVGRLCREVFATLSAPIPVALAAVGGVPNARLEDNIRRCFLIAGGIDPALVLPNGDSLTRNVCVCTQSTHLLLFCVTLANPPPAPPVGPAPAVNPPWAHWSIDADFFQSCLTDDGAGIYMPVGAAAWMAPPVVAGGAAAPPPPVAPLLTLRQLAMHATYHAWSRLNSGIARGTISANTTTLLPTHRPSSSWPIVSLSCTPGRIRRLQKAVLDSPQVATRNDLVDRLTRGPPHVGGQLGAQLGTRHERAQMTYEHGDLHQLLPLGAIGPALVLPQGSISLVYNYIS